MKIHGLIRTSHLTEATKCGIYNTLVKFRPDLQDKFDKIPGRDVAASVKFLQDEGLWGYVSEELLNNFMNAMKVYHKGPDEWSQGKMKQAQDELMCHVAKTIRQSAARQGS